MRARGLRTGILDADFNGPSQARMVGVQDALFAPGREKVSAARSQRIAALSMGSMIPSRSRWIFRASRMETRIRGEPPANSHSSGRF